MEKKIKNPFGKFFRNIILGLFLLISVFCFVPILNATGVTQNAGNVDAFSGDLKIVVRVQDGSNSMTTKLGTKRWAFSGGFWGLGDNGIDYYKYGGGGTLTAKRIYARIDAGAREGNINDACYENRTYSVTNSSTIYTHVQNGGGYVVGFFTSLNFDAKSVIQLGGTLNCANIPSTNSTIYMLVSNTSYKPTFNTKTYLKVGNTSWESNWGGSISAPSTINLGDSITLSATNKYDEENINLKIRTKVENTTKYVDLYETTYKVLMGSDGLFDLYCNSKIYENLSSAEIIFEAKYPNDPTKKLNSNGYTPIFNIFNATDLEKFAIEVNSKAMNQTTYYTARLANDIDTYAGTSIGTDVSPFIGYFDGNGYTIKRILVTPVLEEGTYYYNSSVSGFSSYSLRHEYVNRFGFFQYVENAEIENLTIGKIGVQNTSYKKDDRLKSGITFYTGTELILPTNLSAPWKGVNDPTIIGALCATAKNTKFYDINIENIDIKAQFPSFTVNNDSDVDYISFGGLIGLSENCAYNNLIISNNNIDITNKMSGDKYSDIYYGGFIGYSSDDIINNVNINNIIDISCPKLDTGDFIGGGFVGVSVSTYSSNYSNITIEGNQCYKLYNTNYCIIGGLVGQLRKGTLIIEDCRNYSNIEGDFVATTAWYGNKDTDNCNIGGLVGQVKGNYLSINYCENFGDIKSSFKDNRNRNLSIGGLIGLIDKVEVDCTCSYNFNNEINVAFHEDSYPGATTNAGTIVGYAKGDRNKIINFENCYSAMTDIVKSSSKSSTINYGYYGKLDNSSYITFLNCYAIGNYQNLGNNRNVLQINSKSADNIAKNALKTNNDYMYQVLNMKYDNGNGTNTHYYGYNTSINVTGSGISAPFYLKDDSGSMYGSGASYMNIIIDCTQTKVTDLELEKKLPKQQQFYDYNGQYFYGTGVSIDYDTKLPMTLPTLTGYSGTIKVVGYATQPNSAVIEFLPGMDFAEYITTLQGRTYSRSTLTIYPIFAPSVAIYSPIKVKRLDGSLVTVGDRYKNGIFYSYTNTTVLSDYYEIASIEEINNGSSINGTLINIYKWKYNVVYKSETNYITDLDMNSVAGLFGNIDTTNTNIKAIFSKQNLMDELKYKYSQYVYSYEEGGIADGSSIDILKKYNTNAGGDTVKDTTTVYINLYNQVTLHYADFLRYSDIGDKTDNRIYDENNFAAYYKDDCILRVYQYYSNVYSADFSKDRIFLEIGDLKDKVEGFGNLYNDNGKLIYSARGTYTSADFASNMFNIQEASGWKEIYLDEADINRLNEEWTYSEYWQAYNTNAVILEYYDTNNNLIYKKSLRLDLGQTTIYVTSNDIYSYSEVLEKANSTMPNPGYSFMGWKTTIRNASNGEDEYFVYKYMGDGIKVDKRGFNDEKELIIKLVPIIAKKNNTNLTIDSLPSKMGLYYNVTTPEDLISVAHYVNWVDNNINIKLGTNINMNGYENFMPIGYNDSRAYYGHFNGQQYSITNLKINLLPSFNFIKPSDLDSNRNLKVNSGTYYMTINAEFVGLFGYIGSTAYTQGNVNLLDVAINKGNFNTEAIIGGFAGFSGSNIKNVLVQGSLLNVNVAPKLLTLGGIAGQVDNASIEECISKISFSCPFITYNSLFRIINIGTIAGQSNGIINNCFDLGIDGSQTDGVFAIVPVNVADKVRNCYSYNLSNSNINTDSTYNNFVNVQNNTSSLMKNFLSRICVNHFGENCANCVWNVDASGRVNNGLPYLRNTGISSVSFKINVAQKDADGNYVLTNENGENAYIVTEKDKARLEIIADEMDDDYYKINQDYFVLDNNTYNDLLKLGVGSNGINVNTNSLPFVYLRGYTFKGFANSKGELAVSELVKKQIFSSNKETFTLEFNSKNIDIKYIYFDSDGVMRDLASEIAQEGFAGEYQLFSDDINRQITNSMMASSIYDGKEIYAYVVYVKDGLDESNNWIKTYLNGNFEEDLIFIDNVGFSVKNDLYFNTDDWKYNLNGVYEQINDEEIVYVELLLKDIVYQLQFYESENAIKDINEAKEGDYFNSSEGNLGDEIIYPANPNKPGYIFVNWLYFVENVKENSSKDFLINGTIIEDFLTLEKSPYYAQKAVAGDNDGKYILQLFPYFVPNTYTIEYYDGENILATQTVMFDSDVDLYDGYNINLTKEGYHVIGYEIDYEYYASNPTSDFAHDENFSKLIYNNTKDLYSTMSAQTIKYIYLGNIRLNVQYARNVYTLEILAQNTNGAIIDNISGADDVFTIDYEITRASKDDEPKFFFEETDGVGYNSGLNVLTLASPVYDENRLVNKYVVTTLYNYNIYISILLADGARVENVVLAGENIYNMNSFANSEEYAKGLSDLTEKQVVMNESLVLMVKTDKLVATENFAPNAQGVYEINDANDLMAYRQLLMDDVTIKPNAKLTNNINITGYNIYIDNVRGVLDGDNYSINGFTKYNPRHYSSSRTLIENVSFVGVNSGEILNLNFDNVSVNLKSLTDNVYGLIKYNNAVIKDVGIIGGYISVNINEPFIGAIATLVGESRKAVDGSIDYEISDNFIENVINKATLIVTTTAAESFDKELASINAYPHVYIGGVVGVLSTKIDGIEFAGNLIIDESLLNKVERVSIGILVGYILQETTNGNNDIVEIYNGINRFKFNATTNGNFGYVLGNIVVQGDYKQNIYIQNIINLVEVTSDKNLISRSIKVDASGKILDTSFVNIVAFSIKSIVNENNFNTLNGYLNNNFKDSKFVVAYKFGNSIIEKAEILLPFTKQLIDISTQLNENTVNTGIVSKVNGFGDSFDISFRVYNDLVNNVTFNSVNFVKNVTDLQFTLQILCNGINSEKYFNILDSGAISSSIKPVVNVKHYDIEGKEIVDDYKVKILQASQFSEEEMNNIFAGLNIIVNENEYDAEFVLVQEDDVYKYYNIDIDGIIRFNDTVVFDIALPAVAKLSSLYGITVQNKGVIGDSKGQRYYEYSLVFNDSHNHLASNAKWFTTTGINTITMPTITAEIDRSAFVLIYDLNKTNLLEKEKSYIQFSQEFVNTKNSLAGEIIARINEDNTDLLEYTVIPKFENGVYIYNLPEIYGILDYEYNGIHYKFKGFVDEYDNYFYNENFDKLADTIASGMTLYAIWDAMEYTIKADMLDGALYVVNSNGYNANLERTIKFGEIVTIPTLARRLFASSFVYNGFKLENAFISTGTFDKATNSSINDTIYDDFAYFDAYYASCADENNVVTIVPQYAEVVYKLEFNSNDLRDGYDTYLLYENEQTDLVEFEWTISDILSGITLPVAYKEHHDFYRYLKQDDTDDMINYDYVNAVFTTYIKNGFDVTSEKEKLLLLNYGLNINENISYDSNLDKYYYNFVNIFIANYEIRKVEVKIYNLDFNNFDKMLDYSIEEFNSLSTIYYEEVKETLADKDINVIKFEVDYNTTQITLPTLVYTDDNYQFAGFKVQNSLNTYIDYNASYVYRGYENESGEHTYKVDIYLLANYKVTYFTGSGVITDSYNTSINRVTDGEYNLYAEFNLDLTLPSKDEVEWEGRELKGYRVIAEGETTNLTVDNNNIVINSPTEVVFEYDLQLYTITIDSNGASFPETIDSSAFRVISEYEFVDESTIKIKVYYGTKVVDIQSVLPILYKEHYTHTGYYFTQTEEITENDDNARAEFIKNEYVINVYNYDNSLGLTISKTIDDLNITEVYTPIVVEGLTYIGLSLSSDYYNAFNMPNVMPNLKEEYNIEPSGANHNVYVLNVYAFYISHVNVTILGTGNSMIENTTNLNEFSGGYAYGASASFVLTSDNVLNKNFSLPVPKVQNELLFATFTGYYTLINGELVQVVDASGNVLDNFVYKTNVELTQGFKFNDIDFMVYASNLTTILELNDFVEVANGYSKKVEINSEIGLLPRLASPNLIFKGYYITTNNNTDMFITNTDIQIADETGKLLEEYEKLTSVFFNSDATLKTIVAKFDYDYVDVTITSSNINLGLVNPIKDITGTSLINTSVEHGYTVKLPKGEGIEISATVNEVLGVFKQFVLSDGTTLTNIVDVISFITEDLTIVAEFEYVEFNITYIINGEEVTSFVNENGETINLEPTTFNFDTATFNLPTYYKAGYKFVGWYLNLTENNEYLNLITQVTKNTTSSLTLYGKLQEKILTANIYESVDGYTNVVDSIEITYNTIIANLPASKTGYNFVGYFTEKDGRGLKISNESLCVFTESVNLYAYYKENVETVEFAGKGTESYPYEISSIKDFEYFAYLMNTSSGYNSSETYFVLTTNLELENSVYIKNFKANFDGNGFVIYVNNKIDSYNEVLGDGTIERKFGFVNENEGNISNLILVVNQNIVYDLNLADNIYFGLVAGKNAGEIKNVIVYYNVVVDTEITFFNSIANNLENGSIENCSEYESKFTFTVEQKFNNVLDIHSHNKTNSEPKLVDNKYLITTSEELAYVLALSDCETEIVLQNDINMKGKILENVNFSLNFNGNGYIVSNLIVLNKTYIFNDVLSLNNVAFENLVFINLNNIGSIINTSENIEKIYIKTSINTSTNLINVNNGSLMNSYFIVNTDSLVNENNGTIENVYAISGNIAVVDNGTITNALIFDKTSINVISEIESFVEVANTNSEVWFVDENDVMGNGNLPALIKVGNYVYEFVYDKDIVTLSTTPYGLINNKFIGRLGLELLLGYEMLAKEYSVTNILIDDVSYFEKVNANNLSILTYEFVANYHKVMVVTEIKTYMVSYAVSTGGKIEIDGQEYTEYSQSIVSGTEIVVTPIANEGYVFVGWSDGVVDYNGNGYRLDVITSDLDVVANFEKLNKFNLIVERDVTIDEAELNSYYTWTKSEKIFNENTEYEYSAYVYTVYLPLEITQEDLINNYLLINPIKKDYVFIDFSIYNVKDDYYNIVNNEFDINLNFELNYLNVFIDFDSYLVDASIVSVDEDNISPYSEKEIVICNSDDYYSVLYGYEIKILGNPISSYLTELLINGVNVIDDYSVYANSDAPFEITYKIVEQTDIVISMNYINLTTTFEFDGEYISVMLNNGSMNALNEVVLPKNTILTFGLEFAEGYELDKFEVYDTKGELLDIEILGENNVYSYVISENTTIKIYYKVITFNVEILANADGEILASNEAMVKVENPDYENAFSLILNYAEDVTVFVNPDANYIISNITINGEVSSTTQVLQLNNILENKQIVINFEKVETWLDTKDGELKFALSNFVGLGTETSPYIISSMNDILTIAYKVNVENNSFDGVYFKAVRTDMILDFSGYYFEAIGNDDTCFNGVILGDNLTLRNIKITGGNNVGLFKTLGANAVIKGITVSGNICGNDIVGGICGTNNGTLEGVVNSMIISTYNGVNRETNVVGGVCAINNGVISRSYNSANINSSAVLIGGVCAINTGSIENIYNEGQIVNSYNIATVISGIVANNQGSVSFGYNNARVYTVVTNSSLVVCGTSMDTSGTSSELYFNTNKLTTSFGVGKSYDELKGVNNVVNPLYANWDFVKVWSFKDNVYDLPKLNVAYEYRADITFSVEFGEGFTDNEKIVLIEVSNGENTNYTIALTAGNSKATLKGLSADTYTVRVISLIGTQVTNQNAEIVLEEGIKNIEVSIVVSKINTNGYHASVII